MSESVKSKTSYGLSTGAKAENKISAEEFAQELEIALQDFFCGTVEQKGKVIIITLPNGQNFKLKIE